MGILGFGGMGNWHSNNVTKVDGVKVVAVHDIDQERLIDARQKGLIAYENRAEFLADPNINLVLVATPNHIHKDFAIEALRAGKNVMVEKPVTMTVQEFDEIWAVSKETGNLFTVHHNRRWDRDYLVMKDVVNQNKLGKVYSIDTRVYGNNGQIYGWRTKPEYGGGMVYDWGVHLIDQMLFMHQDKKLESVYAQLFSMMNPEVDDLFKVDMKFKDGPSVHVEVGTFALRSQPRFFVNGDKGTMTVDDFMAKSGGIKVLKQRLDEMGRVIVDTPAGPTRTMAPQPESCFESFDLPNTEGDWTCLYRNLVDVMRGEAELIVTPETVRRTMLTIQAVFDSAKKNQVINLGI